MIASILQDASVRQDLIVLHKVEASPSTAPSQQVALVTLLIDLDSVGPMDATGSMVTVDDLLAGLLARQSHIKATIFWSGNASGRHTCDPFVEQATMGLIRSYLPKFRAESISYVPVSEPGWQAAVSCVLDGDSVSKSSARMLVCSTNADALYGGVEVCRNVDRFLRDGCDLEIFVPQLFMLRFPGFRSKFNLAMITAVEFLMRSGFVIGPPQSDEHAALQVLRVCGHRSIEPTVAIMWMLQRIACISGLPHLTPRVAEKLFPMFSSLDKDVQTMWIDKANTETFHPHLWKARRQLASCEEDRPVLLQDVITSGLVGPWLMNSRKWWASDVPTSTWSVALEPIRAVIDTLAHRNTAVGIDVPLQLSTLWPRLQRNIDTFSLWKLLRVAVPHRGDASVFHVTAALAADLAAPGVLHPAIFLTFALLVGSMKLYEWEWVALLTCCSISSPAMLAPLFECSREGLLEAMNGLLCVFEHVCKLNEICNAAFFPIVRLNKAADGNCVGAPLPNMDAFRHLLSLSSSSVARHDAHALYAQVRANHGTCCAFASGAATQHLSTYHRVLVASVS
jgi:hypothetical protein